MKTVRSPGLRGSQPAPRAQRKGARPSHSTSKTRTRTFSEEPPRKARGAHHPSSSPHRTPSPSPPPPVAAACPSQKTQSSAATLAGGNVDGLPTAVGTSFPTLLETDDSEAKDGMRRPPLGRPNSTIADALPGTDKTPEQKAPTWQQCTGNRSTSSTARSLIARHLAPLRRKRCSASALSSSSHASSSPSVSDMRSTSSRTCSSTSDTQTRGEHRLPQRNSQRNRSRAAAPAAAAHPSASSVTTKGSKTSWCASQQRRKKHRVTSCGDYSNTGSTSTSSAALSEKTTPRPARTSSSGRLRRRKCTSRNEKGDTFLSAPSSTSVDSICVFTDVLPRDVYLHICGFLTEADCCTLLEVSLCMHAAITSADSIVWRHMCVSTWMYKQGFQSFIQHVRALEVLARQGELEVLALQQHMLLLREEGIIFGESDVSATCDCATVLIRRRQHERARWMAAAAAGAMTSTLHRSRLASKVSSAITSMSSTTQSNSSCVLSKDGRRRWCKSRSSHMTTGRSIIATASTSRRSENTSGATTKRPTHMERWAEPSAQRLGSRSTVTTVTSRASRSRRSRSDRSRDGDLRSASLPCPCSSRTSSSSESSKEEIHNGMHHIQTTHPPSYHCTDDPAAPLRPGGSDAGENTCSATRCSPLPPPLSSSHAHASVELCVNGSGGSSVALSSTSASNGRGQVVYEYVGTEDGKMEDRRKQRVRIRLPEAEAEGNGSANLTDTSVLAIRSRSGSRHRRRSRRSRSRSRLTPAHSYRHHHRHDDSSRQQQQPESRHRRSHRDKRRKPARQRRKKRGRSRRPRSTGGGGSRHRSQGPHHRSSHQHHHNPKATKSSRRRRRRQRNAAAAAAAAAQADRDSGGINTYFYQTATYEAIKSTTPELAAPHVAPSMVPITLGGWHAPSVNNREATALHSLGKAQQNPYQSFGGEVQACKASAVGAFTQPATLLNRCSNVTQMAASPSQKIGSSSQQVIPPQTAATTSSAATTSGTGANEERLYWWQLTPEARQRQLRRIQQLELQQQQQQQLAAARCGFATQAAPSFQDGDELADEAALREWDELEASSFGSSSDSIYEEDADASREGDREEECSDRNDASVTSGDTEGKSECSTDDGDEGEGSTDSSDYSRRRRRSRKLWRAQSRSARQSITSEDTMSTTARCRFSYRQHHGGESSTSSSLLHTAPPSLADGNGIASACRDDNEKERWVHTGTRGAAHFPYKQCKSSHATYNCSRRGGDGAARARSGSTADRYDFDEGATCASDVGQVDNKLIEGSNPSSSKRSSGRRVPSSFTSASCAERRAAKALEKRYEGIEEAMVITRSKSMLIHTLERQTHAHLPRLFAAAQRQQRSMINTRPAAAVAYHVDPSLMSPTVALHRGAPDFSEVAWAPTAPAVILIGAGSSGFNSGGASSTLPVAASLPTPPASHLPSSLNNSFGTVTAATLAVPASPLYQLTRASSPNALTSSCVERGGCVSSAVPCQNSSHSFPPSTSSVRLDAGTAGSGGGVRTAPPAPLQDVLAHHRTAPTAAAAVNDNSVGGGALSTAGGAPLQSPNNDEAVDDDDDDEDEEEEKFAPVSWKFAFFMSRREAKREKITLQDLIEGMWVVCFRNSGRTHPIRFVGQRQVFVYSPLPTEEEVEQRLQQNGLEPVESEGEAGHATSAAPPLLFHILQGGAQLVVHQFPPMKVMRRNGAALGNPAAAGMSAAMAQAPSASAPAAAAVTPAMRAEKQFMAEPQATLRKLRMRLITASAHDSATFEAIPYGGLAVAGSAVDDEHNGKAGKEFGCRGCTSYDSHDAASVSSAVTTNDVRRVIAQKLGFCPAYMKEVLGQPPVKPKGERTNEGKGSTTRRGCSAAPSRVNRQRVFHGPLTLHEYEAQQHRESCFAPGGPGDVLNDWGWTISSPNVKIFSLDITAPLYVKRLQRVADV